MGILPLWDTEIDIRGQLIAAVRCLKRLIAREICASLPPITT